MVFCSQCGDNVPTGSKFCGSCGATVTGGGNRIPVPKTTYSFASAGVPCAGCGRSTAGGEKVIVSGKEWHQECYNNSKAGSFRPLEQFTESVERCPGCNGDVSPGMNRGDREKIVIGGKEWHKDCYDNRRGGSAAPLKQWAPSQDKCPGCGDWVAAGMNTGDREKIIIGGKEWHKDCYDSTRGGYVSQKPGYQSPQAETCPGCGRSVAPGMNTGECEKIIIGGKEWHRECYTPPSKGRSDWSSSSSGGGGGGGAGFCANCGGPREVGAFCGGCGVRF